MSLKDSYSCLHSSVFLPKPRLYLKAGNYYKEFSVINIINFLLPYFSDHKAHRTIRRSINKRLLTRLF